MYDVLTIEDWIRRLYAANMGEPIAQRLWIEPFEYNLTITGLVAVGGVSTSQLNINSNADFVLTRISYAAVTGTAQNVGNKTVAQVRVQITDAGSARPFFNTAVPLENFASNEYPDRFLSYPRFLSGNTSLTVAATGYGTAAETYTLDLTFDGMNVRQYSGGMQASALGA